MAVQELPAKAVNLLKSSQVITSLSSVIKELIENSLDAGATVISVKLENYGFKKLEVKDNGTGISEVDMANVAKPHYTSKIRNFEDLGALSSFGFRGEALSSLCAVSDFTISTKTKDCTLGYSYRFDFLGNIKEKTPSAANIGTTVHVFNLFRNIPVRRQYFSHTKRRKEELKKVEELIMAYAIIIPQLHISLLHDKQMIFVKVSDEKKELSLHGVFCDTSKKLVNGHCEGEEFKLQIWLPNKIYLKDNGCSRSSSDRLFVFVNCRPITHKAIEKLAKAYYSQKTEGCHGRYPVGVIAIDVSPGCVDVNLEPNKTKVIFKNEATILIALENLLSDLYGKLRSETILSTSSRYEDATHSLPCTFASLSQESTANDISQRNYRSHLTVAEKELSESLTMIPGGSASKSNICKSTLNGVCTSTQNSHTSASQLPTCSLSTIGEFDAADTSEEKLNQGGEGIQSYEKTDRGISGIEPFQESSLGEIVSETSEAKLNVSDNLNNKKSYQSVVGSDGIPVFVIQKIPGISQDGVDYGDDSECLKSKDTSVIGSASGNQLLHKSVNEASVAVGQPVIKEAKLVQNADREVSHSSPVQNAVGSHTNMNGALKRGINHKINEGPVSVNANQASFGEDCWSRGHILHDNKPVENVKILAPTTAHCEKENVDVTSPKRKRIVSDFTEKTSEFAVKKSKKDVTTILSTPARKAESAFSLFAKDIRKQVLKENCGADFTVVAQEIASRWKNADPETKKIYEQKSKEDYERYISEKREKLHTSFSILRSKNAHKGQLLDRFIAPNTPQLCKDLNGTMHRKLSQEKKRPWQEKSLLVTDSLPDIKRKINRRVRCGSNHDGVVGCLKGVSGWIYLLGDKICGFNTLRLSEVIIYKSLLKSFSVPAPDLNPPIILDVNSLGMSEWTTLLRLSRSQSSSSGEFHITDKRMTANGFMITLFRDNSSSTILHGKISGMVDAVQSYGLHDLKEILKLLRDEQNISLENLRPYRLRNWLKGEALRMARVSPHLLDVAVVQEKLNVWQKLTGSTDKLSAQCLHGQPIFMPFASLSSFTEGYKL